MPNRTRAFGSVVAASVTSVSDLVPLLTDPFFRSETIIIKPNWVSTEPADFVDARVLRLLFEALRAVNPGVRLIVTESHMLTRSMNRHKGGGSFTANGKLVDWSWLQKGEGWRWLFDQPDWSWFREGGHWDLLKEEEQIFLEERGFAGLFEAFGVTYVNVTEEVWNGRIADPAAVEAAVEARFEPLQMTPFYGFVPEQLFALRGSPFISLAKLKTYASFTMKNLFGLIPDPVRPYWHGPDNVKITRSILDINRIYHALFNMFGICEALFETAVPHPQGQHEGLYTGKYNVVPGPGVVFLGHDLVHLDALLLRLTHGALIEIRSMNRDPIEQADGELGCIDHAALETVGDRLADWLPWLQPEA